MRKIEGLYKIDEGILNNLADSDFLKLRSSAALVPAHCQLISMQLLPELIKLDQAYSDLVASENALSSDKLHVGLSVDSGTLDLSNL